MKKKILLLGSIILLGTRAIAEETYTKVIVENEQKGGNHEQSFDINSQWSENNYLNIEIDGYMWGDNKSSTTGVLIENFYRINGSRWEIYTDIDYDVRNGGHSYGTSEIFLGYILGDGEKYDGVIRAGGGVRTDGDFNTNSFISRMEFKNYYTVNKYLELEGNIYVENETEKGGGRRSHRGG